MTMPNIIFFIVLISVTIIKIYPTAILNLIWQLDRFVIIAYSVEGVVVVHDGRVAAVHREVAQATVVVVGICNHLAFLRHVSRLLGEHVAERVVGERCLSACRVVDLRAAVAHVVNGCRHVALGVRHCRHCDAVLRYSQSRTSAK